MYKIRGGWTGTDEMWEQTAEDLEQLFWVLENEIYTNSAISDFTVYDDDGNALSEEELEELKDEHFPWYSVYVNDKEYDPSCRVRSSRDVDEVTEGIVDHWNEYNGFWTDFEYIGGNRIRIEDPDDSNKEPEIGYVEQVPCI